MSELAESAAEVQDQIEAVGDKLRERLSKDRDESDRKPRDEKPADKPEPAAEPATPIQQPAEEPKPEPPPVEPRKPDAGKRLERMAEDLQDKLKSRLGEGLNRFNRREKQ